MRLAVDGAHWAFVQPLIEAKRGRFKRRFTVKPIFASHVACH